MVVRRHALVAFLFLMVPLLTLVSASLAGDFFSPMSSVMSVSQDVGLSGDIVIDHDLVIGGNNVTSFVNAYVNITGNIVVEGNATLRLVNATIFLKGQTTHYQYNITFQNPLNGNPRLIASNAVVRSEKLSAIRFFENSSAVANGLKCASSDLDAYDYSVLSLSGFLARILYIYGHSSVSVSGSDMKTTKVYVWDSAVFQVLNSTTMDSLYSYNYASVKLSSGSTVSKDFYVRGSSLVSIRDNCTVGGTLKVYDFSRVSIAYLVYSRGAGKIQKITAEDFANVSIASSFVSSIAVSDNVSVSVSYCQYPSTMISSISAEDSSNLSIISSYVDSLKVSDWAYVSISSSQVEGISASGHSRIVASGVTLTKGVEVLPVKGKYAASDFSQLIISGLSVRPSKTVSLIEGSGGSFVEISNSTVTYSVLRIRENSVASFVNVNVSSSRFYVEGHSNVSISSSSITDRIEIADYSSAYVSSSQLYSVIVEDSSSAFIWSSQVNLLHALDFSNTTLSSCVVDGIWIEALNVNASFFGLRKFGQRQSISMNYSSGGFAPSLNFIATETRGGLDLMFYGASNVSIADSSIRGLSLLDSSVARLENCTLLEAYTFDKARVYVWSRLRVRVTNYFGNLLKGANVTVVYPNGTALGPSVVDDGGWASFMLFVKMQNATGKFKVGAFGVVASFGKDSARQSVDLESDMDMTIVLPVPWWAQYLIPSLVIVGVLAFIVVFRRVRRKRRPSPI
jgi:hypothetical protein